MAEAPLQLIAETNPDSADAYRFNAIPGTPRAQAPGPGGDITALGDTVHATPRRTGAGAAIREAASLRRQLLHVPDHSKTQHVAVQRFESEIPRAT